MDVEKLAFLTTLVQYPEETATAEYKSGIAFDATDDPFFVSVDAYPSIEAGDRG